MDTTTRNATVKLLKYPLLLSSIFSLSLSLIAFPLLAKSEDERPNVLMLIVDDMNDYGFYKTYPGVKMPYIDAFKETAITFRKAYCASPVCGPSRAAVFSGLHPHTTGSYLNGSDTWRQAILPQTETLPELFKRSGYTTWGRGKLFHAKMEEGCEEKNGNNRPLYGGGFGPFHPERDQTEGDRFWGNTPWTGPDEDFPDVKNSNAAMQEPLVTDPLAQSIFTPR